MSSPRERALARLRRLAAVGAATAAASCHGAGYGVVDPMPMPSCFDSPQPTATASFVQRASEPAGTRFLEVNVAFTQTNVVVGECAAVDDATGLRLDVVERAATANGFRCLLRVPKDAADILLSAPTTCAAGNGSLLMLLKLKDDAVQVEVR